MTAELTVRTAVPADTDRILQLARLSLGEGLIPRHREYWEWKHVSNPFGTSPMLVAEADGELVGLRAFMRWRWEIGGRVFDAVRAVDTATHPAWQGRGIFSRLTDALVQQVTRGGTHFIFNTPNRKSRPGYLKMGWHTVGRTDLWIRPLRPFRMVQGLLSMDRYTNVASTPPGPTRYPAADVLDGRTELDNLLGAVRGDSRQRRLSTLRTLEYLHWRYVAVPGVAYQGLLDVDGPDSALVIGRYKARGRLVELRLCELLTGPGQRSRRLGRQLIQRIHRESGADYMSAMAPAGSTGQRVLLGAGFLPAPRLGPVLMIRSLNAVPDGVALGERASWHLAIGDLELF